MNPPKKGVAPIAVGDSVFLDLLVKLVNQRRATRKRSGLLSSSVLFDLSLN